MRPIVEIYSLLHDMFSVLCLCKVLYVLCFCADMWKFLSRSYVNIHRSWKWNTFIHILQMSITQQRNCRLPRVRGKPRQHVFKQDYRMHIPDLDELILILLFARARSWMLPVGWWVLIASVIYLGDWVGCWVISPLQQTSYKTSKYISHFFFSLAIH